MPNPDVRLKILQVGTRDIVGGAANVVWNLFRRYRDAGHRSWLAVGYKRSDDPDVLLIPNDQYRSGWARTWLRASGWLQPLTYKIRGVGRVRNLFGFIGDPRRWLLQQRGFEDFAFPGTWHLLQLTPERPHVVHCHNLHGGYFDLRALFWLSHRVPVILTLHDAWLISGHCAHSFDCERWRIGCGQCPDLTIYPEIKRDATVFNWLRKKHVYAESHLYVATPSQWLMNKVEHSILAPAIAQQRVVPHGIDLSAWRPGDKAAARAALGLPQDVAISLFVGYGTHSNLWKDYATIEAAVARVGAQNEGRKLLLLCLGEEGPEKGFGTVQIRFVGYESDVTRVAQFYRAADIYLHAAHVDTFPNTVLEALACGTPVVATAVGGISEQIEDGVTGFLTNPGDAIHMADRIEQILSNEELRRQMGIEAVRLARRRFDLNRQVNDYLGWYTEILDNWEA